MATTTGTWRHMARKGQDERGAQVDLLYERADRAYSLCEIKHWHGLFVITKSYAADLKRKKDLFQTHRARGRQVFLAMVTTDGVADNHYKRDLVDGEATASALF